MAKNYLDWMDRPMSEWGADEEFAAPAPEPGRRSRYELPDDARQFFRGGVVQQESRGRQFDPKTGLTLTSPKGALGIAQVMPTTGPEAAQLAGLPFSLDRLRNDPEYNAALGEAYFAKQYEDFGGDIDKAMAAYNAGPQGLRRAMRRAEQAGDPESWRSFLPRETRDYLPSARKFAANAPRLDTRAAPAPEPAAEAPAPKQMSLDDALSVLGAAYALPFKESKPTGTLREMGRQLYAGATIDLPEMVGKGLQFFGAEETGAAVRDWATEGAEKYAPDVREKNLLQESLIKGARAIPPVGVGLATALVPGGQFIAPATLGTLFGASSGRETYEKVLEATGDPAQARAAAAQTFGIQGFGEAAATAVGLQAARPLAAALRGAGTTAQVAGRMTAGPGRGGVLGATAKELLKQYPVQIGTEIAQDLGQAAVERSYGAETEDLGDIAAESAKGAFGLTTLLGPLAIGGQARRASRANALRRALSDDPSVTQEDRAAALKLIETEATQRGIAREDIDGWLAEQLALEADRNERLRLLEQERLRPEQEAQILASPSGAFVADPAVPGGRRELTFGELLEQQAQEAAQRAEAPAEPLPTGLTISVAPSGAITRALGPGEEVDLTAPRPEADVLDRLAAEEATAEPPTLVEPAPTVVPGITQDVGGVFSVGVPSVDGEAAPPTPAPVGRPVQRPAVRGVTEVAPGVMELTGFRSRTGAEQVETAPAAAATTAETPAAEPPAAETPAAETPVEETPAPAPLAPPVRTFSGKGGASTVYAGTMDGVPVQVQVRRNAAGKPTTVEVSSREGRKKTQAVTRAAGEWATPDTTDEAVVARLFEPVQLARVAAPAPAPAPAAETPAAPPAAPVTTPAAEVPTAPVTAPPTTAIPANLPAEAKQAAQDFPLDEELAADIEKQIKGMQLDATVASGRDKVKGRIGLTQGMLKGIVRMLRSPSDIQPLIYAEKGAALDTEAMADPAAIERVRNIYDASMALIKASRDLASAEANAFKSDPSAVLKFSAARGGTPAQAARVEADKKRAKLVGARQVVIQALDNLVQAAGSEANANALIAAVKARTQKIESKPINTAKFKELSELLGKRDPTKFSQKQWDERLDQFLSSAWRARTDTTLQTAEETDTTTGREIRVSKEKQAKNKGITVFPSPLVRAATEGQQSANFSLKKREGETDAEFAARKATRKETGLQGVLNYISANGTAFERAIVTATTRALRARGQRQPALEFIPADQTPGFDPAAGKTGTVRIHENASPEQAMHEALHAALQWYVYENWDKGLAAINRLQLSLKRVLDTNVDDPKLQLSDADRAKAKEVIAAIRAVRDRAEPKGVSRKEAAARKGSGEKDAVLELISYGTTLREFRRLLKQLESTSPAKANVETRGFLAALGDLWNRIAATVQSFLGVTNKVANDVLEDTVSLLARATEAAETMPTNQPGRTTLQAAVGSDAPTVMNPGRRSAIVGMAAALAARPVGAQTTLGKAKPIPAAVLDQRVSARAERLLRGNGGSQLDGAQRLRQVMEDIGATGPAELRPLARLVGKLLPKDGVVLRVDDTAELNAHGVVRLFPMVQLTLYTAGDRTGLSYETLLHEALHVAVASRYAKLSVSMVRSNDRLLGKPAPAAAPELAQFEALWTEFGRAAKATRESTKDSQLRLALSEATRSPDEFFVRALTDPIVQNWMAGQRYEGKTLMQRFKDWVKESLFGMKRTGVEASWLDAALTATEDLTSAMVKDEADFVRATAVAAGSAGQRSALYSRVEEDTSLPSDPAAQASGPSAARMTDAQFKQFSKKVIPKMLSTEFLFRSLGWPDFMKKLDDKAVTPLVDFVEKNTPRLAQSITWVHSHFGLDNLTREKLVESKDDRRAHTAISERIAKYIANQTPEDLQKTLGYLNGRLDFLRGLAAAPAAPQGLDSFDQQLMDRLMDNWWEFATNGAMSEKDRNVYAGRLDADGKWRGGLKFTQSFIFPENLRQLASNSFGARNLRELRARKTKEEVTDDAIRGRRNKDGTLITDDTQFLGLYRNTPELQAHLAAGNPLSDRLPDEFVAADLYREQGARDATGQPMLADSAMVWSITTKRGGKFRLQARYDAASALRVKSAKQIGDALQNTMTLLANSYSARNLAAGLYNDIGTVRDADGNIVARDGSAVVFDSLDQLNAALNGTGVGEDFVPETDRTKWTQQITPAKVINIGSDEAKSEVQSNMFRNRRQWVRIPQSESTYGALAGKIVNGSVWAAIQDASDRRPVVKVPGVETVMRWHKGSKTKYNPATWVTNVATNITMAMADDIPMATLRHAARLYAAATLPAEMRAKLGIRFTPAEQEMMANIMNSNALLGTFSTNEIKRDIYEAMKVSLSDTEGSIGSRLMQFAGLERAKIQKIEELAGKGKDAAVRFDELMGEWYAAQDNVFRVASVLNQLGQMSEAGIAIDAEAYRKAGDHARNAFLDYDIDAKAIRIMRQTAFPFISWPYATAKLVGRLAIHKPWKLVNLYAAYAIIDGMFAAMAGDDDDELRKAAPEYMQQRIGLGTASAYIRLPFLGDSENPVYYHLGKYMFPSSLVESSPNGFAGMDWWPSAITPTGPFISAAVGLVGGVDPFNGKPLTDETATNWEAATERLKFMQSQFAPNIPYLNAREIAKFEDAISGRTDKSPNFAAVTMARYAGLRLYDFNVEASLDQQVRAVQAITRKYKEEISRVRRAQQRLEEPDWDAFEERQAELLKRMNKRIAEVRGEEYDDEE